MNQPSQPNLKYILASIEDVQSMILQTLGPNEQIKKGCAAEPESLKAPVYFLWERLGYGTINRNHTINYWMSSFYISPIEYLEECIRQLKKEMGVVEYDREPYGRLIGFYGDMIEVME